MKNKEEIRKEFNEIDDKIIELLNERYNLSKEGNRYPWYLHDRYPHEWSTENPQQNEHKYSHQDKA